MLIFVEKIETAVYRQPRLALKVVEAGGQTMKDM